MYHTPPPHFLYLNKNGKIIVKKDISVVVDLICMLDTRRYASRLVGVS